MAANLAIENERQTFTENLAAKKRESTLEESEENTQAGENLVNDGGLSPEVEEAYLNWKKDFEASLADGLAQYQSAIAALQKDYNDVLEQIAAKELEFAQKEQEIKDYENNVRDGIQLSVNQMRQSLLNSGLYYEEDCNGVNECTVDWSTMNQSGVDLVALLDQIQQGLDNDAPLSQLAQQMRDYLEVREQETEQRQQYWQNLIRGVGTTQSYIDISAYVVSNHHVTCHEEAELSPAFQSCLNNAIFSWFNLSALYNNSPVGAAMRAIEGSDRETIKNHIQSTGEFRDVETVLNTGIEGVWAGDWYRSGDYFRIMKQWVDIYSNRGRIYCAQLGWPSNCYNIAIVKPNTLMQVLTVYNWYDSNADDNSQTWQGYSDEVSPLFDSWDNDILPAIQTWEAQVAAFNSEHTAWQITANQQKAQADNAYQDGLNQLALSRNQWLAQMSDDYRDAKKDWIALQNQAEDSVQNNSNSAQEITPPVIKTAPAFDSILSQSRERINSLVSVADYRITTQPDASLLDDVTRNFQKGIKALANLGAAESINDRAVNNREEHINKLSYALESSGYTITRQKDGGVTATREIHTGNAIRNGGDGTSEADYIAEKQDQTYSVNAPRAVKLVQTGSLNDDWDLNEVLEEYNNSQKQIDEEMDIKFESLDNDLRYMNEIAIEREKQYQESLEKQIADAQQWKSLIESIAQSMLGGMSFSDAATSAFQSQIRGKIADAIAEATGLPSGFLSGILGGAKPHEAFASYVQGQAYSMLEQAWGLPSGLLSTYASKKAQEKAAKKAKQQAVVNAVATVAAVVAAPFTGGASVAVLAAVKAAQGAAQGGLKGAVMGAAGAFADAGTRFLSGGSVGMDLSYSYENGFGAGVSIGLGGGAGLNLGISERGGVTAGLGLGAKGGSGFGLSTTYKEGEGLSGSFGYRSASGTALGLNYSKSGGASAYLGASLNKSGTRTAGLSFSKDEGVGAYVQQGDLQQGAGRLTFNQRDGFGAGFKAGNLDMSVSERGGASVNYKAELGSTETDTYKRTDSLNLGFNSKRGYSVSLDSTTTLGNGQSYNSSVGYRQHEGLTSNITSGNNFASKYLITSQDGLRSTVDTIAADQQEAYRQEKKMAFLNDSRAEMEKRRGEPISDEEWNNPENREDLLHEAGDAVSEAGGEGSENISQSSRLTMWDDFTGVFEDAARGVFGGQLSDSDGYIDEQGNYHQRTCFVAGTPVVVMPGTPGAYKIDEQWYKDIENIVVGDKVLSWNEETGEQAYSTVTETFIHDVDLIYTISYEDGTRVQTTWNHPFYMARNSNSVKKASRVSHNATGIPDRKNGEWVEVKDIRIGDFSLTQFHGEYLLVDSIFFRGGTNIVYNIHLSENHTFYVSNARVLVHNYPSPEIMNELKENNVDMTYGKDGILDNALGEFIQEGESMFNGEHAATRGLLHPRLFNKGALKVFKLAFRDQLDIENGNESKHFTPTENAERTQMRIDAIRLNYLAPTLLSCMPSDGRMGDCYVRFMEKQDSPSTQLTRDERFRINDALEKIILEKQKWLLKMNQKSNEYLAE